MSSKQFKHVRLAALLACALGLAACGSGSDSRTDSGASGTNTAATSTGSGASGAATTGTAASGTDTTASSLPSVAVTELLGVDAGSLVIRVANKGFRFSLPEMIDIVNPKKLKNRMFYDKDSEGPDAAWFDAIKRGNTTKVREMIEAGQNLEAKDEASLGQTALGWAAFIGYEDIVDLLLEKGASVNATDRGDVYNVLKSAALGKNVDIVRKIHQRLPDTDLNDQTVEADGETLIMVAASNNRLAVVKYLIEQGADVNLVATTKDETLGAYDQGPLSYACTRKHPDMVKLLVAHGAINHRNGKPSCE
ncbi:MAG: ankyrin repeat domain-containing protein [Lautropia sp.]|nr:ankyrin repeat domain-containing protein [Lautropia sp.]